MSEYCSLSASQINHIAIELLELGRFQSACETLKDAYQNKDHLEEAVQRRRAAKKVTLASRTRYTSLFLGSLACTSDPECIERNADKVKARLTRTRNENLPVIRFCGNEGASKEVTQSILGYNIAVTYHSQGLSMVGRKDESVSLFQTALKLMKASDECLANLQLLPSHQLDEGRLVALRLLMNLAIHHIRQEVDMASDKKKRDLRVLKSSEHLRKVSQKAFQHPSSRAPHRNFTVKDIAQQNCRSLASRGISKFELPTRVCSKADLRRNLVGFLDGALDLIEDAKDGSRHT